MNPETQHAQKMVELTGALETLERQSRFITDKDELITGLRRMIITEKRTALDSVYVQLAIDRLDHAQQVTRLFRDANPTETECIQKARNVFSQSVPNVCVPAPQLKTETVESEPPPGDPSLLEMAAAILQERRSEYGPMHESFASVAQMWSSILGRDVSLPGEDKVTSEQVALMMIAFKLCRHIGGGSRDDLVDICGYAELLDQLENEGAMQELLHAKSNRPQRVPDR